MFFPRRPSARELEAIAERSAQLPLSYTPVGMAGQSSPGFSIDQAKVVVGRGETAFAKAKVALLDWRHFDLGWVEVFPRGAPVVPGTVVLVLAHHLGFWSVHGCRVLYLVTDAGDAHQFGFAHGTLTNHAEKGEEVFRVRRNADTDEIVYEIRAVSRPRALVAWWGYPITRWLQARFRRDSMAVMRTLAQRAR